MSSATGDAAQMASISWTESSAFTRAKLDDGSPPLGWWVKPASFAILAGVLLAFPLARGRPMNDSWMFTVLVSLGTALLVAFILPFMINRAGDQWVLNASGIGVSGWRGFMMFSGHWKWKDVAGYRLSSQEYGGVVYEALEVRLAEGVILKAGLGGRAKRDMVESVLLEQGIREIEAQE